MGSDKAFDMAEREIGLLADQLTTMREGAAELSELWIKETRDNTVLRARVAELEGERGKLREFVQEITPDNGCADVDGGDFHDAAERLGLLVTVPADEDFKAEFDADTMNVWAWLLLATPDAKAASEEPDNGNASRLGPNNCVEYVDEDRDRWAWSESNCRYERVPEDGASFTSLRRRLLKCESQAHCGHDGRACPRCNWDGRQRAADGEPTH
jgi:hypothetical protein